MPTSLDLFKRAKSIPQRPLNSLKSRMSFAQNLDSLPPLNPTNKQIEP